MACLLAAMFGVFLHANASSEEANASQEKRPNFVLIIADDVGFRDIGCYGSKNARTPRLDSLAQEGLRLTNAILTASSCSPSRASILTGRYPHNNGAACELHRPIPWHLPSLTGTLRDAGYYTALSGKNHMSWSEPPSEIQASEAAVNARPAAAFDHVDNGQNKNASPPNNGGHANWVRTLRNRPSDQPFLLWLASYDAHRNWEADSQWDQTKYGPMHRGEDLELPPAFVDTPATRQDFASYLNEVTRFDYFVGRVIDELKKQDLWENTYLFVLSDNGRPFPRGKTRLNDDGMQTFLILSGPTLAARGSTSDSLVSVIDIAPTIVELAAVPRPATFQGRSFASLYSDPDADIRPYAFSEHNWHDYEALGRSVRDKRYLFIQNDRPNLSSQGPADSVRSPTHQDLRQAAASGVTLTDAQADVLRVPRPARELYDRETDPFQTNNLIDTPQGLSIQTKLSDVLTTWRDSTGDSSPEHITPDKFDRNTGVSLKIDKKGLATLNQPPPGHDRNATEINAEGIAKE